MIAFFKDVFQHFFNGNTFQKGASLAYYAVFSMLPIIVIVVSLFGMFLGKAAVSGEIYDQLSSALGSDAANQIQEIIKGQHTQHNSVLTSILGFATLALSASGMFSQLHNAFNSLWDIKAKPKSSLLKYMTKHLGSFGVLITLFFILLISTTANSFLIKHAPHLHTDFKFAYVYEHVASFVVIGLLFAIMFKFLGDAKVHWKAVLLGGFFTSLLFLFGKIGIAYYIGRSNISSTFGSASVLALIMLWVYYTSQIIFLGASFVKVVSDRLRYPIKPNRNAVKVEHRELP